MPKAFDDLFGEAPPTPSSTVPVRTSTVQEAAPEVAPPVPAEVTVADLLAHPFCYLSGPAGTGKTFLARQIIDALPDAAQLCATTGIAAVNLGDATTINSFLRYFDTGSLQEKYLNGMLQTQLRSYRRAGLRRIILDEVSMLDARALDFLVSAIEEVNDTADYDQGRDEDYNPDADNRLGLILCGDFAQLPPVKAAFAFEADCWGTFAEHTFTLTTIRRQTDRVFVEALQAIRRGDAASVVDLFAPLMTPATDIGFDGTSIVARNDILERINLHRHRQLDGAMCTYVTQRSGEQQSEWLKQIPPKVEVKVGALVMILANRAYPRLDVDEPASFEYVNGDLGIVLEQPTADTGQIKVQLQRTGGEVWVRPVVREWKEPTGLKKQPYTIKGTVTYMPLRLAYAATVHKSQGLSLDRVQVNVIDHFFGSPGMLYVALSRARSLEGMTIVGNPKTFVARCATDKKIAGWL